MQKSGNLLALLLTALCGAARGQFIEDCERPPLAEEVDVAAVNGAAKGRLRTRINEVFFPVLWPLVPAGRPPLLLLPQRVALHRRQLRRSGQGLDKEKKEGSILRGFHFRSGDDGLVSVWNTQLLPNNRFQEICGYAVQPDPEVPGELAVSFGGEGEYKMH